MSKIIIDKVESRINKTIFIDSDVEVNGDLTAKKFNTSQILNASMVYASSWQKPASDFEFAFLHVKWWNSANPTQGNKPYSQWTNSQTGNLCIEDYINNIKLIVAGTRIAWMDEDTSKYFDWEFTFVNPNTLQEQVWEPRGMIMANTAGIIPWNNTTTYSVGNKVTYGGFIWKCVAANTNQTPVTTIPQPIPPAFDYWQNTGIPINTGFNGTIPNQLTTHYDFNVSAYPGGQANFYLNGSLDGGIRYWGYQLTNLYAPNIEGKMPIITLNVYMNQTNSNRFPTPFNVQHQMNMLDYINSGFVYNPNTLPKVDYINLGSNLYNNHLTNVCNINPSNNPQYAFSNGYVYGSKMVEYVTQIRANSEPITANAKIIMASVNKSTTSNSSVLHTQWAYDSINPSDTSKGFIHGFYNQTNNPAGVDFDIISLQTNSGVDQQNYINALNNQTTISWSYQMGGAQYINMKDTIADCKTALDIYGKKNRIKYWYKYMARAVGNPSQYTWSQSNYSWAAQTGVFMAMILTLTDPDFTGFQYNSLIDNSECTLTMLYFNSNVFGPNTTNLFGHTNVGWMFRYFLNYFKPEYGALSYTRILKSGGLGINSQNYGYSLDDYCMGVYINYSGINNTPKHRIILCNYSVSSTQSINIDSTQLIDPNWTNVQFMKVYTPLSIYDPINFWSAGNYITVQEISPYTPNSSQILSTPLLPTEYLIITAY